MIPADPMVAEDIAARLRLSNFQRKRLACEAQARRKYGGKPAHKKKAKAHKKKAKGKK